MYLITRNQKKDDESGTTLLEMTVVILIIGLLSGLSMNWMLYDHHRGKGSDFEKENALVWFDHLRSTAIYDSTPYRLCLSPTFIASEKYIKGQGWKQVNRYRPTDSNVVIRWEGNNCSGPLNTGIKFFLDNVQFETR